MSIQLLRIHRRRLTQLERAVAAKGEYASSSQSDLMEIASIKPEILKLEGNLKARQQALAERAAIQGINADPATAIEIEDIQEYFNEVRQQPITIEQQHLLLGAIVTEVRPIFAREADYFGVHNKTVVITFNNGVSVFSDATQQSGQLLVIRGREDGYLAVVKDAVVAFVGNRNQEVEI